jgi:hypothetical protein
MDADQLLQAYAAQVAGELGSNETTSTSQLLDYGRQHFAAEQFLGVHPAGRRVPRTKHRCFYIHNTLTGSGDGHWLATAREPGKPDLGFDSFGRTPGPGWQPQLAGLRMTDSDLNQELDSTRCGQICLGFGHLFLNHGYDVALQC